MTIKWTNNATTTIASGISNSDTTITVAGGTGALFPTLGAGDRFYATLNDSSNNIEIVEVTARSGDVMTVVRGQDGTTALAWVGGDKFELRPTAAGLLAAAEGENIVDLAVSQGGTGADNSLDARINLDAAQDPDTNGFIVRNGDHVSVSRSITAGTGITVTNGDGQAGDVAIDNDGVLSVTAGTGITVTGPAQDPVVNNDGVLSVNGQTGDVTVATGGGYKKLIFTSPGTYTKPAGLKALKVTVIGGGGGGSGAPSGVTGAGGTAGGYSEETVQAPAVTATVPVSIGSGGSPGPGVSGQKGGNGGTTSFGGYASATGGTGGGPGPVTGNGGQGLGGDINLTGDNHASKGLVFPLGATVATRIGCGTPLGRGGLYELVTLPTWPTNSGASKPAALLAGTGYGSGGGGGIGPSVGGDGMPGVIIVEEFY